MTGAPTPSQGIGIEVRGLELHAVRKQKTIISDINCDIEPGTLVACIGPSGCGKSTLLRCLAGIAQPSQGGIAAGIAGSWYHIAPATSTTRTAWFKHIGLVTQEDHLVNELSVADQLGQACHHGGLPASDHPGRIEQVLGAVHLNDQAATRIENLSGGQQRRLSIARSLIKQQTPGLLLLDEPTSGLDINIAHDIMDLLKSIADAGTTVFCTSHLPSTLILCDQVLVMGHHSSGREHGGTLRANWSREEYQTHVQQGDRDGRVLYRDINSLPSPPAKAPARATIKTLPGCDHPPFAITQVGSVVKRSAITLCRDHGSRWLLLLQPMLLAFLIFATQSLQGEHILRYTDFFGIIAALWLGMSSTIRDFVSERPLYAMERLSGLTPTSYLSARLLWGTGTAVIGAGLLLACLTIGLHLQHGGDDGDAFLQADLMSSGLSGLLNRFLIFALCGCSGALLGLIVSVCARSVRAALSMMPLVVLPQMLISRIATGRGAWPRGDDRLGAFQALSADSCSIGTLLTGSDSWDWLEYVNAAFGLLTTSRHASWVIEGRYTSVWLLDDLYGFGCVLIAQLLLLWLLFLRFQQRRWIGSLANTDSRP